MVLLSKEDINALPLFHYHGETVLIRTQEECEAAVARIMASSVVGVDTETRPSFHKGKVYDPSLVQVATQEAVYLFQLAWTPFDSALAAVFENPSITKAGVAVHDDFRSLARLHPFEAQSVFDLGTIARTNGIENQGLRGLAGLFLNVRVSKGERCSNWGNKDLSPKQIRYAATDAWVSLAVYLQMQHKGFI